MKRLGIVLFFLLAGALQAGCHESQPVQPVTYPIYCQPCPQVCVPSYTQSCSNPCTPVTTVQQAAPQGQMPKPGL